MASDKLTCVQCGGVREPGNRLCENCQTQVTLDSPLPTNPNVADDAATTALGGAASTLSPDLHPTLGADSIPRRDASAETQASHSAQDSNRANKPFAQPGNLAGSSFGDYELIEEIARGGMGVVFKARHRKLHRLSALKMILAGQLSSKDDIQRFHVEAEAAARLDHPGIVPLYEVSEHQGQPYYAMKFIEGGSLSQHRDRIRSNPKRMARFVAKIARAVHHAHQRGILHRDLKPANILIDEHDEPLITDLGLAKSTSEASDITQTGAVIGTPSYMSPEQAQTGQSLTTAADIYSIGAILYEMLTGRPPFQGNSAVETVMQVLNQQVTPPRELDQAVDRDLELICMQCLKRDPDARYSSAAGLADDLESWASGKPISVRPPSLIAVATQWIRRNQGIGYALLALFAGFLFSFPLVLSLLGALDDPAALYADTEQDPRPFLYSFTSIPAWYSAASSIFMAVLWPLLGLIVTLITRPPNWQRAALNGGIVGGTVAALFTISLGWALFMVASQASSNTPVRMLAESVWQDHNFNRVELEKELIARYPLLEDLPQNQRVNYVSNRIFADALAEGPLIWLIVATVALLLGTPIVAGTVIAQVLIARKQRWWLFFPRYLVAWVSAFFTILIYCSIVGGNFNGKKFHELEFVFQLPMLTVPALVTYLLLRRYRKPREQ